MYEKKYLQKVPKEETYKNQTGECRSGETGIVRGLNKEADTGLTLYFRIMVEVTRLLILGHFLRQWGKSLFQAVFLCTSLMWKACQLTCPIPRVLHQA